MNRNRQEKGITLIALVVTIIILLILAGITINSLTGSGLFENAKLAKEKSENAERLENQTLEEYKNEIEKYVDGNTRENNSSAKRTVLFDGEAEGSGGPITSAGTTDGTSERTFSDNVNNYDLLLVYAKDSEEEKNYPPSAIDRSDFNKEVLNYVGGFSSYVDKASNYIKIDTTNNKIIFISKGHIKLQITKVIGYKF